MDRQLASLLAARAAIRPLSASMGSVIAAAVPAAMKSERPSSSGIGQFGTPAAAGLSSSARRGTTPRDKERDALEGLRAGSPVIAACRERLATAKGMATPSSTVPMGATAATPGVDTPEAERLAVWEARCGGSRNPSSSSRSHHNRSLRNEQAAVAAAATAGVAVAATAASLGESQMEATRELTSAMGELSQRAGGARAASIAEAAHSALISAPSPAGHAAAAAVRELLRASSPTRAQESRAITYTSSV